MQKFAGSGEDCKYPTGKGTGKLQQSAEKILKKVQAVLLKPEVKQAGKEQIKKKARESIKEKLAKGKLDADRKNRERWEREGRIAPTKNRIWSCKASDFLRKPGAFCLFGGGEIECI